ncbi:MAG: hypothetical protein JWN44_5647 [Myxococcales bacterium]|nr:hypothetical protein [Myxococcales bacterium]
MRLHVPLGICMLLVGGCSNNLDQQSATKVMTSALNGTAAAQVKLKPVAGAGSASFDGDIQNPAGSGSAHVTGSAASTAAGFSVNFDIAFAHWTDLASNVTLDGSLHEAAAFSTMSPFVGSVKITGDLAATGAVQAAVAFDLALDYSPTKLQVVGNVGGASLNATLGL